MNEYMSTDELLTTTRTVRRRLDFDRPVPAALIEECIDVAIQAPTGSMKQNWHWVVVGDPDKKARIGEIYRDQWVSLEDAGKLPDYGSEDPRSDRLERVLTSASYLAHNIARSPWLVIPCGTGRKLNNPTVPEQSRFWGSVLPAMWNFMLAARARGLGCAWTAEHLVREEEVAKILGIPYPEVTQCGLFPVAYTVGTSFKRANSIPGPEVTHWNGW
jgi:nitroreductase